MNRVFLLFLLIALIATYAKADGRSCNQLFLFQDAAEIGQFFTEQGLQQLPATRKQFNRKRLAIMQGESQRLNELKQILNQEIKDIESKPNPYKNLVSKSPDNSIQLLNEKLGLIARIQKIQTEVGVVNRVTQGVLSSNAKATLSHLKQLNNRLRYVNAELKNGTKDYVRETHNIFESDRQARIEQIKANVAAYERLFIKSVKERWAKELGSEKFNEDAYWKEIETQVTLFAHQWVQRSSYQYDLALAVKLELLSNSSHIHISQLTLGRVISITAEIKQGIADFNSAQAVAAESTSARTLSKLDDLINNLNSFLEHSSLLKEKTIRFKANTKISDITIDQLKTQAQVMAQIRKRFSNGEMDSATAILEIEKFYNENSAYDTALGLFFLWSNEYQNAIQDVSNKMKQIANDAQNEALKAIP